MTSTLSEISEQRLSTCAPQLQLLVRTVALYCPIVVLVGHRTQQEQDEAYRAHRSKLQWPDSLHNKNPAMAVDIAPSPYQPENITRLEYFGGFVLGVAAQLKLPIRWGGCWAQDHLATPNHFQDLFHFEIRE